MTNSAVGLQHAATSSAKVAHHLSKATNCGVCAAIGTQCIGFVFKAKLLNNGATDDNQHRGTSCGHFYATEIEFGVQQAFGKCPEQWAIFGFTSGHYRSSRSFFRPYNDILVWDFTHTIGTLPTHSLEHCIHKTAVRWNNGKTVSPAIIHTVFNVFERCVGRHRIYSN